MKMSYQSDFICRFDFCKYRYEELLGAGAYGEVWRSRKRRTNQCIAIKYFKANQKGRIDFKKEKSMYEQIRRKCERSSASKEEVYEHLIKVLGFTSELDQIYLIAQELLGTNLNVRVYKQRFVFSYDDIREVIRSMASALKYLKMFKIIHRDLKLDNVCFSSPGNYDLRKLKIIDLGCGLKKREVVAGDVLTPFPYRAPELILSMRYGCEMDVWSLGCMIYEIKHRTKLFPSYNNKDLLIRMEKTIGYLPARLLKRAPDAKIYYVKKNNQYKLQETHLKSGEDLCKRLIPEMDRRVIDFGIKLKIDRNGLIILPTDEEYWETQRVIRFYRELMIAIFALDMKRRITPEKILASKFLENREYLCLRCFDF